MDANHFCKTCLKLLTATVGSSVGKMDANHICTTCLKLFTATVGSTVDKVDANHICKTCLKLLNLLEPCVYHCFRCGEIYCNACVIRQYNYIVNHDPDLVMKFCSEQCYDKFLIEEANEWVMVDGTTITENTAKNYFDCKHMLPAQNCCT